MAGRPKGAPNKDKPYRDALRMEEALLANGEDSPAKVGSLRYIARQQLIRAGSEIADAKEIADRMDGKPAQAVEMSGGLSISHEEALDELE